MDATASGEKRKREDEDGGPNPLGKRKVVLLVAYNGAKFHGLQKNPDVETVEETLENAIYKAGGIRDDNFGVLQKISWSRAGRTDKGVHALGQIISLKMILAHESMVDAINAQLNRPDVRVLGIERANNNFCAHTSCTSREYEYLLPVSVLRQSGGAEGTSSAAAVADVGSAAESTAAASSATPLLSAADMERLQSLLRSLEGTHSFHNFTDGTMSASDKQAQRYMIRLAPHALLLLEGVAYVPLFFHGQSFLLHQIRKMVALVCATFRGDVPADALQTALADGRIAPLPMAPSCALIRRRACFEQYERRRKHEAYSDRSSVHFPTLEGAKDAYREEQILPHVARAEASGEFAAFVKALRGYHLAPRPDAEADAPINSADRRPALVERWAAAKRAKDFETADQLRDELRALGVDAATEKLLYTDGSSYVPVRSTTEEGAAKDSRECDAGDHGTDERERLSE